MLEAPPGRMQILAIAIAVVALAPTILTADDTDVSPGLLRYISRQWGDEGKQRVIDWRQFVYTQEAQAKPADGMEQNPSNIVSPNNSFWNRHPFLSDKAHWGADDYWATPIETLASNGGDCEDYSIGKYFTLKELGTPIQKLRITYVRALSRNEPHMVLAYYPEPDADPLILDNLTDEILPASKRPDLEPVFSFNDEDLWTSRSRRERSSQIRLWQNLLDKMAKERKL